jgi:hypothetical protein
MTTSKFRKKPVVIEAVRFVCNLHEIDGKEPSWYEAARTMNVDEVGSILCVEDHLEITTLEGVMRANPGDWIIRGVKGEIYPCKPDIFEATYDPV